MFRITVLKKYSAFVLESGLSRNKDHYIRTLNYKNDMLNINYQKFMIDYNVRKQQVQDYDSAMIGTVMVPSINEKTGILYVENQYGY